MEMGNMDDNRAENFPVTYGFEAGLPPDSDPDVIQGEGILPTEDNNPEQPTRHDFTESVLDVAYNLEQQRARAFRRVGALEARVRDLVAELAAQRQAADEAVDQIRGAFQMARESFWGYASAAVETDYVVGDELLADAVRLSPPHDRHEPEDQREDRVRTALATSSLVTAGVPTIVYRLGGESAYCAAIPEYDGLSIHLDNHETTTSLMVGVGPDIKIPLTEAWTVEPALPGDELTPPTPARIETNIRIFSAEEAQRFIGNECIRLVASIDGYGSPLAQQRSLPLSTGGVPASAEAAPGDDADRNRQQLVEAILAAHSIGLDIPLPDNVRTAVVGQLREHLYNVGDQHTLEGSARAMAVGQAMRVAYGPDADTSSLAEYIIAGSQERFRSIGRDHYTTPLVGVLEKICGKSHVEAMVSLFHRQG